MTEKDFQEIKNEIVIKTSRSQGPGGQNVNKVSSRVELRFNIRQSTVLKEVEKQQLEGILKSRLTKEGELLITSQVSRSQLYNKEDAFQRMYSLLNEVLRPKKKRKATRPTRSSIRKRLENKKRLSEKKQLRSKQNF